MSTKLTAMLFTIAAVVMPVSVAGAAQPSKHTVALKVAHILTTEGAAVHRASGAANFGAVASDFNTASKKLRALKYPKADKHAAKVLESAIGKLGAVAAEAAALGTLTSAAGESLLNTLSTDSTNEIAASTALRTLLGLPAWHKGEL